MNDIENKKNNKKNKYYLGVTCLGICLFSCLFSSYITNHKDCSVVNALADNTYPYIYNLMPSNSPINVNWIGDTSNNIVYVSGTKYENVKNVKVQNSLGQVALTFANTELVLPNTQDVSIVAHSSTDVSDLPNNVYSGYVKMPYQDWTTEFISNPNFIDTFANQNYQGIPITSIAYSPSEYVVYNGVFYSNGKRYSTVKIRLAALNGTEWLVNNKTIAFNTSSHSELRNMCYVANVKYDNDIIYQIDGTYDDGDYYLTTSYRWINDSYRTVHFLADYINPNYPNYPSSTFKEMFEDYNYGRMIVVDDSLKDAFNVIALAITSILPMMNFKIASDITLGTLILVPLTLGIILAIIKLFKR